MNEVLEGLLLSFKAQYSNPTTKEGLEATAIAFELSNEPATLNLNNANIDEVGTWDRTNLTDEEVSLIHGKVKA